VEHDIKLFFSGTAQYVNYSLLRDQGLIQKVFTNWNVKKKYSDDRDPYTRIQLFKSMMWSEQITFVDIYMSFFRFKLLKLIYTSMLVVFSVRSFFPCNNKKIPMLVCSGTQKRQETW